MSDYRVPQPPPPPDPPPPVDEWWNVTAGPPPTQAWLYLARALRAAAIVAFLVGMQSCFASIGSRNIDSKDQQLGLRMLALALGAGVVSIVSGFGHARWGTRGRTERKKAIAAAGKWLGAMIAAGVTGIGALIAWGMVAALAGGSAWGRPLRLRGRILHPNLRRGADWTRGDRPDASRLDPATRAALEALWLHDAQKEHASVPAFSRISWMLAAIGAPAELIEGAHVAALEEIDHTRRCFALAAGYGGQSHSVEAMPDLLVGGLDFKGDPLVHLAVESVKDGCLLEDFNADVAQACALVCEEPVTRNVLERIAREERSHAEYSWRLVEWLIARGGESVRAAIEEALDGIEKVPRPTATSGDKRALVEAADPIAIRAHGRLRDEEWEAMWSARVAATRARGREVLAAATGVLAA